MWGRALARPPGSADYFHPPGTASLHEDYVPALFLICFKPVLRREDFEGQGI